MENQKILIIVPAYNEESNILTVLEDINKFAPGPDILVINDGSSDRTEHIAKGTGAKVISLPFNLGYGAALQAGYIYAANSDYDVVVQIDADGQHDPRHIKELLLSLENDDVDVVIGSRFLQNNGYKVPWTRRLGMMIFGTIASIIIGQKVTDSTSGFQALKKSVVRFFAKDIYPSDYPDTDMLILLHLAGFRLKEVPVKMYNAGHMKKSMHRGHKVIYYIFKMFLSIVVTLMRKSPSRGTEE